MTTYDEAELALAQNIQRLRKAKGMTQIELAEAMNAAGFSSWRQSTVYKIEDDKPSRRILLLEAFALSQILGADLAELVAPIGSEDERWLKLRNAGEDLGSFVKTLDDVLGGTRQRIDAVALLAKQIPESETPAERQEILSNLHPSIRSTIVKLEDAIQKHGHKVYNREVHVDTVSMVDEHGEWHDVPVDDVEVG